MWIPPRHVWHVTILFLIFQTSYYGLKSPALSGPFCLPNPSLCHIPFTPSSLHWPLFTSVCQALSSFRALAGIVPSFWKDLFWSPFISFSHPSLKVAAPPLERPFPSPYLMLVTSVILCDRCCWIFIAVSKTCHDFICLLVYYSPYCLPPNVP